MISSRIFVNDRWVEPGLGPGAPALDFIRGELGLKGTKEGCREGDCGACAVLVGAAGGSGAAEVPDTAGGSSVAGVPVYKALPSCLLALGELEGKHLITIEGLVRPQDGLTPVMKAFLEENASQCGFCTPGFIISLTAWLCAPGPKDEAQAMRAVDGNLCRCTGYGSIRRAATRLCSEFADLPEDPMERLKVLVEAGVMPGSVLDYAVYCRSPRLAKMPAGVSEGLAPGLQAGAPITIGGGTDYYVRNPHPEADFLPRFTSGDPALKSWGEENDGGSPWLKIGAGFTVSDFFALPRLNELYPSLRGIEGEFASTLVRNLATIGGNLANASPVGDLTCIFMGLGARLELKDARGKSRRLGLEEFFLGYKKTALEPGELIAAVLLPARPGLLFSFSKIAKRRNLDIAAVNSTLSFRLEQGRIREPRLAAGGVGPTPLLLPQAAGIVDGAAVGRNDGSLDAVLLAELAREAARAAAAEIRPIDDVRGSAEYRRRMMERMVLHHFIELFAEAGLDEELKP